MNYRMLIFAIVVMATMNSCAVNYFKSGKTPIPHLEERGDLKVGVSVQNKSDKADLSVAYSPVENLGIQFNTNSSTLDMQFIFGGFEHPLLNSRMNEFSVGYYNAFENGTMLQAYCTYGFGNLSLIGNEELYKSSQNRFGAHLSYKKMWKNVELGGLMNFYRHAFDFRLGAEDWFMLENGNSGFPSSENQNHFADIGAFFRVKDLNFLDLEIQLSRTSGLGHMPYFYHKNNVSMSMLFNIDKLYKKSKKVK